MTKNKKDIDFIANQTADFENHIISLAAPLDGGLGNEEVPKEVPVLTLRSAVIFPGSITPVTIGRDISIKLIKEVERTNKLFGAVLQKDAFIEEPTPTDMYKVGTLSRLLKLLEMPNGTYTALIQGLEKFEVNQFFTSSEFMTASVSILTDRPVTPKDELKFTAIAESVKDIAIDIIEKSGSMPKESIFAIKNLDNGKALINFVCSNFDFDDETRQDLLEAPGICSRGTKLLEHLITHQQLLKIKIDIQNKTRREIDEQQKEYFLKQQMSTIQDELGYDNETEFKEMAYLALSKKWSQDVMNTFDKEMAKFEKMNPSSAEYSVQHNYLQLMLDLPWGEYTEDNFDLNNVQKHLDKDHFGLDEVKDRILEHIAVLKLKGDLKSPIICLYGPPGVGKTSLGKSVADSLNRKYGRISLGGLHDESEIRGHRRTYIGAMCGRVMQTIKKCGSSNPVIILDEIDKVSRSNHGDPASALLEVLDPEQNTTFHDNYLDIEYDLSKVLFIATANNVSNISTALRDRMEMINVSGYLIEEKIQIAKKYVLPKLLKAHGVKASQLKITEKVFEEIISSYTRESGVRGLDKLLAKIIRYRAKQIGMETPYKPTIQSKDLSAILGAPRFLNEMYEGNENIGVVTGLAWTQVGGDILYIESTKFRGKGGLSVTGNLGDVMKESATIALQWIKSNADKLNIDYNVFSEYDFHIHVPEGATPKDGPSAGITIATSLASMITERKVKERIAMTGEITLRGKVLPVGGIKEKILAAKRAGINHIILSEENKKDILDIKPMYVEGVTFSYVNSVIDVIKLALL